MNKVLKEIVVFCVKSIVGGMLIAIAAIACLFAIKSGSTVLGSVLFSFALVMIILTDMKLFTGVISLLPETQFKKYWVLPLSFIFNLAGIMLIALIFNFSFLAESLGETAKTLVAGKLGYGLLSGFLTGILCGVCISLSTITAREAAKKGISPVFLIMFPVIIFVYCGFEHSVADLAYFALSKTQITWEVVGFFSLVILGNLAGGPIVLLVKKLAEKFKNDEKENNRAEIQEIKEEVK